MCESVVCVSECMKVWERSRLWPALGPMQGWTSSSNLWPKLSLPAWKAMESGVGEGATPQGMKGSRLVASVSQV